MERFFKSSLLLAFLLPMPIAWSQVRFGVKIGTQFTNAHLPILHSSQESYVDPQCLPQVGAFMEVPLSSQWSIQSSINWSPKGFKLNEVVRGGISGGIMDTLRTKVQSQYLELPVFLTYRFRLRQSVAMRVGMGPYLALGVQKSVARKYDSGEFIEQFSSSSLKLRQKYNPFDVGGKAALGLEVKNILMELTYTHGLSDVAVFNSKTYNRALGVSVGYLF